MISLFCQITCVNINQHYFPNASNVTTYLLSKLSYCFEF